MTPDEKGVGAFAMLYGMLLRSDARLSSLSRVLAYLLSQSFADRPEALQALRHWFIDKAAASPAEMREATELEHRYRGGASLCRAGAP